MQFIPLRGVKHDIAKESGEYTKYFTSFLRRFSKAPLGLALGFSRFGVEGFSKIVGIASFFRLYDFGTNPMDLAKAGEGGTKHSSVKWAPHKRLLLEFVHSFHGSFTETARRMFVLHFKFKHESLGNVNMPRCAASVFRHPGATQRGIFHTFSTL